MQMQSEYYVCLSVYQTRALWQTEGKLVQILHHTKDNLA